MTDQRHYFAQTLRNLATCMSEVPSCGIFCTVQVLSLVRLYCSLCQPPRNFRSPEASAVRKILNRFRNSCFVSILPHVIMPLLSIPDFEDITTAEDHDRLLR